MLISTADMQKGEPMILIDMEMPDNCYCCILCRHADMFCRRLGKMLDRDDCYDERPKNCPLHEVTAESMSNKPIYTEDEIKEMCDKYMSSANGYYGGAKDIIEASKDMPIRLRRPTAIVDTNDLISRRQAIENVCKMLQNCFDVTDEMIESVKITICELPPSPTPSRPYIASLETPCDDCDFADKCTYESNCPREAIWKAEHEGGAV